MANLHDWSSFSHVCLVREIKPILRFYRLSFHCRKILKNVSKIYTFGQIARRYFGNEKATPSDVAFVSRIFTHPDNRATCGEWAGDATDSKPGLRSALHVRV